MRRTFATTSVAVALLLSLTACGGGNAHELASPGTLAGKPLTARAEFQEMSTTVPTANLTGIVAAENDPNHLLGRPHEYTSKVTFSDSWVSAVEVTGADPGDVERGGAIEAFANPADAKARAAYIHGVTKSLPVLAEYDYVHGSVLVRVSHCLTPKQAAQYESAAATLDAEMPDPHHEPVGLRRLLPLPSALPSNAWVTVDECAQERNHQNPGRRLDRGYQHVPKSQRVRANLRGSRR